MSSWRKQFRKLYKTPNDEKRDHRNFTEHLAGGNQLEFDTFELDEGLGKYDSAVEARYNRLTIRRPKGRLPFDSNLLTAGQVKFSAHNISQKVRQRLRNAEDTAVESSYKNSGKEEPYSAKDVNSGSLAVYDAVYNILENRRTAMKASEHFHRPKIYANHVKDVKGVNTYGYKFKIGTDITPGAEDEFKDANGGNLYKVTYDIDWAELRSWLYGFKQENEIRNIIISQIVENHGKVLKNATKSSNPIASITAALEVALSFQARAERITGGTGGKNTGRGPITCGYPTNQIATVVEEGDSEDSKAPEGTIVCGGNRVPEVTRLPDLTQEQIDELGDLSSEILQDGVDDAVQMINIELGNVNLEKIDNKLPLEDIINDIINNEQTINNMRRFSVTCDGAIIEAPIYFPMNSTVDLSSVKLDESQDRNNIALGTSGYTPTRKAWRLPWLGDANVFKKHPMTSADSITLIDVSGSMGSLQSKFEKGSYMRNYVDPLQQAADIAMAIKKRFPESKAYGFTNYMRPTGAKRSDSEPNAGLYEIKQYEFPGTSGGATPLCGALKGIESNFTLDNARVIVITDGDANFCNEGDALLCSRNIIEGWRTKGIRFATVFTPRYSGERMPTSLPSDLNVRMIPDKSATSSQIDSIFAFLRG